MKTEHDKTARKFLFTSFSPTIVHLRYPPNFSATQDNVRCSCQRYASNKQMSFSHRNPMKDYQKQKEELDLIKQECTIEWVGNMILEKKAKVSRLTDEISNIQQYVQALEVEKANILEVISQQNAWAKTENLKQTLKLLDINSK
jgi:PleD family two-component response regulator